MADNTVDEVTPESVLQVQRNLQITAAIAATTLAAGTVFYHYFEKLTWVDSFYFCVITLATVGYGDIVPHTDIGKLFTSAYVLVGIGIFATFANLLLKNRLIHRQQKRLAAKTNEKL